MGFTSEYVVQEDVDAFKLDALVNQYQNSTALYKHHWVVDKQMNSWLIPVKQLNNFESIWVFHYKDTNIEIKLYKKEDRWDLISIASNPFDNQEVIHSLREALNVLGDKSVIYATQKEMPSKENKETQAKSKKTAKRKIGYLDILTAIIVVSAILYILSDNDITSSAPETNKPRTAQKINSYESLNEFIKNGQKKGYFPKKILKGFIPGTYTRLEPINIEHYKTIKWDINAKCSNSASDIILGLDNKNHSIECGGGDTVVITGKGNDWVDDAFGNDIFYTGEGNDTIKTSWGNDIFIFEKNWGHDKINFRPNSVDTRKIKGYDGSYPWEFTSFIIFGKEINRSDIRWRGNTLVNKVTGDTIELNSKNINIIFSSEDNFNMIDKNFVPTTKKSKEIDISQLKGEALSIKDGIIYLGNATFSILNYKDKSNIALFSQTYLAGPNITSIKLKGDIAYVTQAAAYFAEGAGGWVSIIDIKNKESPKVLKTLKFSNSIFNVAVHGNYLYIADTNFSHSKNRKLLIYDISIPSKPKLVSTTKLKHYSRAIAYLDGLLFLSTFNKDITVFNVKNIKEPKQVTYNFSLHSRVQNIKTYGDKLIFAQDKNIVSIFKINNFQKIQSVCDIKTDKASLNSSNKSSSMAIKKGLLYMADLREGISIIDIDQCKFKKKISFDNMFVTSVGVINNNLIAMNKKKMVIYDLKNTKNPYLELSQDQLQTLLYKAAVDDDANKVQRLCKAGANPDVRGHNGNTPLQISARLGNLKALKVMLNNGAKVDGEAMMVAALREQIEAMKLLAKYGGNIGQTDKDGCSTLHYIAQDASLEMVKYLVNKGVSYKTTCRNGETPLKWAKYGKNTKVIKYLKNLDIR